MPRCRIREFTRGGEIKSENHSMLDELLQEGKFAKVEFRKVLRANSWKWSSTEGGDSVAIERYIIFQEKRRSLF